MKHPAGYSLVLFLLGMSFAQGTHAQDRAPAAAALEVFPLQFELAGMHEGRQLLVELQDRDMTRKASYAATRAGVVRVTGQGYVRPVGVGATTITVEANGQQKSVRVTVRDFDDRKPLHFANDIVPLLTRHGCNAGGCHGRASGQNGFRLSLFGFDADFDFNALVKEARGRRLLPAAPDHSLLLLKATGRAPHGGGRRLDPDGEDYLTMRRWIMQGTPIGDDSAPTLRKLTLHPNQRVLQRSQDQQLAVLAHYSDGSVRDVTRQAQFQSNEIAVASVDGDGLVRTFDLAGDATIMARYMGQVATFRALVPLGKAIARYPDFPAVNYIDDLALVRWKKLGIVPSELCSDSAFIRRVYLDLCGRLPTPDEVRAFLADKTGDKRSRLIDTCLDDRDYAAYTALRWGSILRNASLAGAEQAAYAFHDWIRDMVARNRPYDEFVRGIVAAAGEWQDAPAVNWYWQMRDDQLHQPVADTAQVFLGLRLQCAKCHHHPYERWSQDDYFGLAGFFSRLGRKGLGEPPPYYSSRQRTTSEINPRTGKPIEPKLLDGPVLKVAAEDDPRHRLVDWMAQSDNPFFARALVNRVWGHLMGRGLVDPVDDMRETNPPSNADLLDALAKDFIAKKFDVKHIVRTICNSRTYQLSGTPNEYNQHDKQNHARYYGRRLIAEVLHDAVDQACGTRTQFSRMSRQARAVDLPHENFGSYFLDVFDRPPRSSACECARSNGASLSQVLHMSISGTMEAKIGAGNGRVAALVAKKVTPEQAVEELYLATLSRQPTPAERERALAHIAGHPDRRRTLEDVLWALVNTREFMFNH
ncbi:MAG: DUF1553 domain-containing protein [Planctomycetes bacterium]|nr:DUF1553 domain-containing protein [Planctomycetota bacterium]